MTCIVGIAKKGKVYLGADSFSGNSESANVVLTSKLKYLGAKREIGFGGTGSWRMLQLIAQLHTHNAVTNILAKLEKFTQRALTSAIEAYIISEFVPALRKELLIGGWLTVESNKENSSGVFLLGLHGQLYMLDSCFSVTRKACMYDAAGSGAQNALGSLHTTAMLDMEPQARLRLALRAAASHNPYVRGPYKLITV